jgi:hypothetical protein
MHKRDPNIAGQIRALIIAGITRNVISRIVDLDEKTIAKHYGPEVEDALSRAIANVSGKLYEKAMSGDNACMFFFLKTRAGWRETNRLEHTGANGAPIQMVDLSKLTDEHITALEAAIGPIADAGAAIDGGHSGREAPPRLN